MLVLPLWCLSTDWYIFTCIITFFFSILC
jgi:hypothetical protein